MKPARRNGKSKSARFRSRLDLNSIQKPGISRVSFYLAPLTVFSKKLMTQASFQHSDITQARWRWFVSQLNIKQHKPIHKMTLSSHALLLEIDMQTAFCAGAWVSVILLACAALEAKIRQIDTNDHKSKVESLFGNNPELRWLREIRNELMHSKPAGTPSIVWKIDGHDLGATYQALEDDARRAVRIYFQQVYSAS